MSLMRAASLLGPYNVSIVDVPVPTILNSTDAVVRIVASAICGSDLHFYHNPLPGDGSNQANMGHEAIGYISEIGDAVHSLNVGDYVVIPDNVDDGHYDFGPTYMPHSINGLQAEYARVPFADSSLIPVPVNNETDFSTIIDYLFVSDIFATGWGGLDYAGFEPGDTVAVFGAGPVGLLTAYSANLRGASKVYVVDQVQDRLDMAEKIGAIPINFADSDPVEQLLALEPNGVTRSVDAVGFPAVNATGHEDSGIILRNMQAITAARGGIGIIGLYGLPGATGESTIDVSSSWFSGLSARGGIVLPLELASNLVPLINSGSAKPSFIVTATIGIEEVPEYYRRFDEREEIKVVIKFP